MEIWRFKNFLYDQQVQSLFEAEIDRSRVIYNIIKNAILYSRKL